MPRVTREQARAHRAAMVDAAGHLLREGGAPLVTIEGVSARAGITRGSFYQQFASKEALLVEALDHAIEQRRAAMDRSRDERPNRTVASFADVYLSTEHRDAAGDGCVVAALAGNAQIPIDADLKDGFLRALDDLVAGLTAVTPAHDEQNVLAQVALLVGALQLARASAGTSMSDAVLQAARRALSNGHF